MKFGNNLKAEDLYVAMLGPMNAPWRSVLSMGSKFIVAPNTALHFNDDGLLDFYFLASGRLRLMHCAENGSERTILYLGPGNIFNDATSLVGYDAPDCTFITVERSEIYRFAGQLLKDMGFLRDYPQLISNLMSSLATKVLMMHVGLSSSTGVSSTVRVCRFLCSLARQHQNKLEFDPGLSQYDLANLLGLHRASIVRVLSDLRKSGTVLKFTKHHLRIGNLEQLCRTGEERN